MNSLLIPHLIQWVTMVGMDNKLHHMPTGEEHEPHYICICDPVPTHAHAGIDTYIHRVLSC